MLKPAAGSTSAGSGTEKAKKPRYKGEKSNALGVLARKRLRHRRSQSGRSSKNKFIVFDLFGHISQAVFQDPVAALSLDNQTVFNDYFQPIDFGTTESFNVTLNGPTALGGGPSAFNIAFYAADGATSLLTVSPDGNAGQIVVNPDGTTAVATFASGPNAGSALTITAAVSSSVPEPADLMLLSISFAVGPAAVAQASVFPQNAALVKSQKWIDFRRRSPLVGGTTW